MPRSPALWSAAWVAFASMLLVSAGGRTFNVVAYNVENLFDIDGVAVYDDMQPESYRPAHLLTKARNAAEILKRFNRGAGPDVILFQEFELDRTPESTVTDFPAFLERYAGTTLEQMLKEPIAAEVRGLPSTAFMLKAIVDAGMEPYHVIVPGRIVYPGEELGAIKNVIFSRFAPKEVRTHPTTNARPILEAVLDVEGHSFHVFNNHWKSGASNPAMEAFRLENARTLRNRLDEILKADPYADILIGGDLNSHYNHAVRHPDLGTTGINHTLGSQGDELALRQKSGPDLYNLWHELPPEQRGSDEFQGHWGTLMHLIVSRGLYDRRGIHYVDNSFRVARFPGLNADASSGRPIRWNSAGDGLGYSDHLPIMAFFSVGPKGADPEWIELSNPSRERFGPAEEIAVVIPTDGARVPSAGEDLRSVDNIGKLFKVKGRISQSRPLSVTVEGIEYQLFSHDREFREQTLFRLPVGTEVSMIAEFGQFRGNWQFVLNQRSWLEDVDPLAGAIRLSDWPTDAALLTAANRGKIFYVTTRVSNARPLSVKVRGDEIRLWSHDADFRTGRLFKLEEGQQVRFYGELGQHQGNWQFVIREASWLR
jgi:endonuclease/exonuclease/phosphatase family metal-dependent hydrolase